MRRRSRLVLASALAASLALGSCDAMFEKNLFAGIVQKDLSASSVSSMSSSEVADLTGSKDSMDQLAADPDAKGAALAVLEAAYDTPAEAGTASGQEAAIASATISIQTVPAAASFSASAVALAPDLMKSGGTADLATSLKGILPSDVAAAADAGATTPPASFAAIVNAYVEAYAALSALGGGLSGSGEYAAGADVNSGEKLSAAVNGLIGYELATVSPAATGDALVNRLWGAVTGTETVTFSDPTALADGSPIKNLAAGAGLTL